MSGPVLFSGILYKRTRFGFAPPDEVEDDSRLVTPTDPLPTTFPIEYENRKEMQNRMKKQMEHHQKMINNIKNLKNPS